MRPGLENAEPNGGTPASSSLFGKLYAAHRDDGYAAGYRRASSDVSADLVLLAEEFARSVPGHDDAGDAARRAVRAFAREFGRHLERRIDAMAAGDGDLVGGLGI